MKRFIILFITLLSLFVLTACGGSEEGKLAEELHLYNWDEYIDPAVIDAFEAKYNIKVIEDTYSGNEELLAKLQAGAAGYDVIVPSDYMVEIMIKEGLLAEINHDNLPNLSNLSDTFTDPPYDPGMKHCVPYQWGTIGLGYNSDVVEPDSLTSIFDPDKASQFSGKITMLNDARATIGMALKYLGHSVNTIDEAELEEAKQLLIEVKPFVYAYESDRYEDMIVADEAVIGLGWNGDYFVAAGEDDRVWYSIPKEGAIIWADNLCIPQTTKNQSTAELFINFVLEGENSAKITNFTWYASPNVAAEEFINPEILGESAIYPSADVMTKLEWIEDVGEATPLYERIWTEIKAAGS